MHLVFLDSFCNTRESHWNAKMGTGSWLLLRTPFVWFLVFLTQQPGDQFAFDTEPQRLWKKQQL